MESTITAKLQQDPSPSTHVDGAGRADRVGRCAVGQERRQLRARSATFDTNAALVDAIKSGDVQWAVDQQPFLQGYLAIDSLWLYINNKNLIGGGQATLTGPVVHRETNIDSVAELAKSGTR